MAWETHPALSFNGTTSVVNCGNAAAVQNLHDGAMTVEAWVNPTTAGEGGFGRIFEKGARWNFYITTGLALTANIDCVTTDGFALASNTFTAGRWAHVAMTWDDATMQKPRLWLHGREVSYAGTSTNRSGAIVSDATDTLYRGNRAAGDRTFNGLQGWARISNVVRYSATFAVPDRFIPPASDANTVLLQYTDEGTGTTITDQTGNATGTASNASWTTQSQGEFASTYEQITTSNIYGSRVPHQRCCFYAAGRYWAFYGLPDGTPPMDLVFISSVDRLTWTSPTVAGTYPNIDAQWSVRYDDATGLLHVVANITTDAGGLIHNGLTYRAGTPGSDGAVTWLADWQEALAVGNRAGDHSLNVGTDGHVWIGYSTGDGNDGVNGSARCLRNNNTDGTWSTTSGFPATIQTGTSDDRHAILAPLLSGEMYALTYEYNVAAQSPGYIVAVDGTVTLDTATATASAVEATTGAAAKVPRIEVDGIADGVVHLVYQDTSQNIKYASRSAAGTWSSETTLSDSTRVTAAISSPRISFGTRGERYVGWSATNALYLTQNLGGGWETPVVCRAFGAENSLEHLMPAVRPTVAEGRLLLMHLGAAYEVMAMTAWVGINPATGGPFPHFLRRTLQGGMSLPRGGLC